MYLLILTEWRSNKYKVKMGKWLCSDERVQQADDRDRVMRSGEIKFSLVNYRSRALLSLFMWISLLSCRDRELQLYNLFSLEPYCQISELETIPLTVDYRWAAILHAGIVLWLPKWILYTVFVFLLIATQARINAVFCMETLK